MTLVIVFTVGLIPLIVLSERRLHAQQQDGSKRSPDEELPAADVEEKPPAQAAPQATAARTASPSSASRTQT
jgi:hypothetical protein